MKILHISDTHQYHDLLPIKIFEDIDLVIHSGDATNYKDPSLNHGEMINFLNWYEQIPVSKKLYIAGNHDAVCYNKWIRIKDFISRGLIYLEDSSVEIEGIKIWGSPYTPNFNNWFFTMDRSKIYKRWEMVPEDTDIFITHGPPKGVLDLSHDVNGKLEYCGDSALGKRIKKIRPKLVTFGHIHSSQGCENQGVMIKDGIIYSNASVVTDNKFGKLTSFGNIFNVDLITKKINVEI